MTDAVFSSFPGPGSDNALVPNLPIYGDRKKQTDLEKLFALTFLEVSR